MERSLSVLLPVRNVQSSLAATVHEILDVLPELTRHFELVIIDDGSRDATIEVADELAAGYPQIRVLRHGEPLGRAAAIRTGIRQSQGDVIFLRDEDCGLPIDELPRLWRAMDEHELVLGCPEPIPEPKWNRWKKSSPSPPAGFQMAHRRVIGPIQESLADQVTLREKLSELGCRWHEVLLRERTGCRRLQRDAIQTPPGAAQPGVSTGLSPRAETKAVTSRPKAPNYLTRVSSPAP